VTAALDDVTIQEPVSTAGLRRRESWAGWPVSRACRRPGRTGYRPIGTLTGGNAAGEGHRRGTDVSVGRVGLESTTDGL
jgi:hypothetical protein